MKKALLLIILCLFVISCSKLDDAQSIQDILNDTKDYDDIVNETVVNETAVNETINETVEPEEDLTYRPNRKCKNAVILYDGCKWVSEAKTAFNFKLISASRVSLPGVWFSIFAESGEVKTEKRTGEILTQGRRSYEIDYQALVEELGPIKRFEVYPIEIIGALEYACENQKIYTIPTTYCKNPAPVRINEDGSINTTG